MGEAFARHTGHNRRVGGLLGVPDRGARLRCAHAGGVKGTPRFCVQGAVVRAPEREHL